MSQNNSKLVPIILCGGVGSRLWPLSREQYPKQLLTLNGEFSLLQSTLLRLNDYKKNIENLVENLPNLQDLQIGEPIIVTNETYCYIVAEQLRQIGIKHPQIILEPCGRNTAPALSVAALFDKEKSGNDQNILLVMAADHFVKNTQKFQRAIFSGINLADQQNRVITFGVKPTEPHTGYGYIRLGKNLNATNSIFEINKFVEKPNAEIAKKYIESGEYLWNSGIFMMKTATWLEQIQLRRPEIFDGSFKAISQRKENSEFIRLDKDAFVETPSDSIDYAVAEHLPSDKGAVVAMESDVGWSDLGSWDALYKISDKNDPQQNNVFLGDVIAENTKNCYIRTEDKLVACLGLENMVVVETDDAVMISSFDELQNIKKIVGKLNKNQRNEAVNRNKVFRPWGSYERIDFGSHFQVKRIVVNPGACLSLQMHYHRAEHWIVVIGTAKVTRGEEQILLSENQSIYIPLGIKHRLENPGLIPLEIIEVQSGRYLDEDDIVRFEDNYGRT